MLCNCNFGLVVVYTNAYQFKILLYLEKPALEITVVSSKLPKKLQFIFLALNILMAAVVALAFLVAIIAAAEATATAWLAALVFATFAGIN